MTPYTHGGNIAQAARLLGIPASRILDFSANVNPMGLPARAAQRLAREASDPAISAHYPDPESTELRCLLSQQLAVPTECILIGSGAAALIHSAICALAPRRCLIPVPAFCEYERACRACGSSPHFISLPPDFHLSPQSLAEASPGDLVILNNPHNPSGACASRDEMLVLIAATRHRGAYVLVDEAFVDYSLESAITREAVAPQANAAGLIAIRSLTKFYGCPGLRVGYAVAAPETASRIAAQSPPWPVSTLAQNALAEALRDNDYMRETLETNRRARAALATSLAALGCRVHPGAANFLLIQLPARFPAAHIRERLLRDHAILVRDCDSFRGLEGQNCLRVAVRRKSENSCLLAALTAIFGDSR
jgi:threonine-phosphate decarboxylase